LYLDRCLLLPEKVWKIDDMTQLDAACYSLSLAGAKKLENDGFNKLKAVWTQDGEAVPFAVLDCFEQPLRGSGRLLLETRETLELLLSDGQVLTQSAKRSGDFVSDLCDGPVKDALADLSDLRILMSIGTGEIRLETLTLVDDVEKIQCRAHLRTLTTEEGGALLMTLRGVRGYDKALSVLRRKLVGLGACALGRGAVYLQLFPGQPGYQAKPKIDLTKDMVAVDAANDIIAAYIPVVRANEAGIIADHDSEFLHDYRIALRKIRSVTSLFKGIYKPDQTADLKARFSDLMSTTGRLRDLDVYLLEKQKFYDLLPQTLHGGLDMLFSRFAQERGEEQAKLALHLQSKSYEKEIAKLEKLFRRRKKLTRGPNAELSAGKYSSKLIWKRYRKVCETAAGIDTNTTDEEVHALRIHCKKLRYLMEFFAPLFPQGQVKSLVKPLKHLQDNLGLFNDYAVQQDSLAALLRQLGRGRQTGALELAQSIGALIAMLHLRQLEERAKVTESFAQFNSDHTRQTFRTLFKG